MNSPHGGCAVLPTTVAEVLELARVSKDTYLAPPVTEVGAGRNLYGGQVAAQALSAARYTVPDGRFPHSIHGNFLKPGDSSEPITFQVELDRDGGQYSSRRVVATQSGEAIFHAACSFATPTLGVDFQATTMPVVQPPDDLETFHLDPRWTFDVEARVPEDSEPWYRWPARLWLRLREPLAEDPNVQACGLVFMSDLCTGLSRVPGVEQVGVLPSLDHTVWLHRCGRADDWVLLDLAPISTSSARGLYMGGIYLPDGTLLASLVQESLFGIGRRRKRPKS